MADFTNDHWAITPEALSEVINKKRKELNKFPVDLVTMMTHLVLKSNVTHPGLFDFEAPVLRMDAEGIKAMEELLNEQFGLFMNKNLSRHCTFVSPAKEKAAKAAAADKQVPPKVAKSKSGIMSKLSRMFGR